MRDSEAADRDLVARALARSDPNAFGELVRRHQSQVRNFLRKLTRDPDLADDLAQDTFVQAWNRLTTYAGSGTFIGWLMKVAYTTFLQSKRKSSRYDRLLQTVAEQPGAAGGPPQESDELGDLDRLLAVLTDEERAVMILSYACGLSHREIGVAAGMPVGTVKSVIYRGKEKIRDAFEIRDGNGHQHG